MKVALLANLDDIGTAYAVEEHCPVCEKSPKLIRCVVVITPDECYTGMLVCPSCSSLCVVED